MVVLRTQVRSRKREKMVFPSEQEQIEKFEKDHVAQHYFEVLRTLISKKSVFAQQVGLKEVAKYLGEIFKRVGAEEEIDETYTAPFVMEHFKSSIITMTPCQQMATRCGQRILLPFLCEMALCMGVGLTTTKATSQLV